MNRVVFWARKKLAGFSLLELMVVVAILGVLATVAVPRFNIFRARARQSEAKSNLGVIFTLQEAFAIDNQEYYNGDNAHWGGTPMNARASRDGYRDGGTTVCEANKLGFRLANCDKARYGYWMAGANETEFLTIAFAASDTSEKRIFPGCDGTNNARTAITVNAGSAVDSTGGAAVSEPCLAPATQLHGGVDGGNQVGSGGGDGWCIDNNRRMDNYYDIVTGCTG